ncbi:MAG: NAD-dependent epimerase/dehydratase family protein, partial [Bacteroidota bacterium]
MKVLIAGSHGMVGSVAAPYLAACGHQVTRLVTSTPGPGDIEWNPDAGKIDASRLEGFDGVINLATVRWPFRWTAKAKKTLLQNRLATNGLLARSLAACTRKPEVLICASGMGYYPSSADTLLAEDGPAGTSFLSRFDQEAEAATAPATAAGIRVVHLRIPLVIGGAMLQFLGFQAGDGQQWMSWIGR